VGRDGKVYIPESGQAKQKYFCKGAVDREFTDLPVGQITGFERAPTEDIPDAEIRTSPWAKSLLREFPADRAF
jgi:hypothetical protein